jgi:metallo-beta-lactamase class B
MTTLSLASAIGARSAGSRWKAASAAVLLISPVLAAGARQQAQPPSPKPDSPEVTAMIEQARQAAGPKWAYAVHFWCEEPRPNRPDDPVIVPTKIFDNVYAIGNSGTTAYVIRTSAGLLMIDALSADQVDSQLLPAFEKLGLDPAELRIVLVAHGHADHFGGSAYLQEHFGTKVFVSAADWSLMERPPTVRGSGGPSVRIPRHDGDITDGQAIVLGDLSVAPVAVPGHTPGSMGFIFPVRDRGTAHVAALFGGAWLTPQILSDEALKTFLTSVQRFETATMQAKVDGLLQNHMLMDPIQPKLDMLAARREGSPNPFVVGQADYQRFLGVMEACTRVNIKRRQS